MTKILYAGTASDFTVTTTTVLASPNGTVDVVKLNPGAALEAWTTGADGAQILDIALFTGSYDTPGSAAPGGIFPSQSSSTFLFWAEDNLGTVYVTGQGVGVSDGQRWLANPVNMNTRLLAIEALNPIGSAQKGVPGGIAQLDPVTGLVPDDQLPETSVSGVTSVNGESGVVTLSAADVDAVPETRKVTGGVGLTQTGSGELTGDVTIDIVFGDDAGTAVEGNDPRLSAIGTSPRPVYASVLSADAPQERKDAAASDDYTWVCDGTNDEAQINLAINAASPLQGRNATMPADAAHLGKVELSGGRFNIGGAGIVMRTAVHLEGAGFASTELRAVNCNQSGLIRLGNVRDHLTHLSDFMMEGNAGGGGSCSAIDYDMTGSIAAGGTGDGSNPVYPLANPDSYHQIHGLYITQFRGGTRHGIYLHSAATANNRANRVSGITMRDCSGNGIYLQAASDCTITDCEIGGSGGSGFHIATGNTKILGCKSFYSNVNGFYFSSGRGIVEGCESQDDNTGFFFDASPQMAAGLVADSANAAGIRVSSSDLVIAGFQIFSRGGPGSGIRYEVSQRGIWYDGAYSRCTILGNVKASVGITAPVSGTAPTGNVNVIAS